MICELFKTTREKKGLSIAEVSRKTGVSIGYLYEIERGQKIPGKSDKVKSICNFYGLNTRDVISAIYDEKIERMKNEKTIILKQLNGGK